MKSLFRYTLVFLAFSVSPLAISLIYAQPPLPPINVPVDGGVVAVLTACAAYGAKKLYDTRKK